MKRYLAAAGLALSALAANASATSLGLLPGEWQFTSRVVKADMPGVPPGMNRMMTNQVTNVRTCVTPEQAQRDPRSIFQSSKGRCEYKQFSMAAGRVSMTMVCAGGTTMTTAGSYTPTSYSTHSTMVMTGPHGRMTMVSDGSGKLLGPCRRK